MSTTVPERRVTLVEGEAEISKSVRSVSWVHATQLHQWIAGRGVMVVPSFRPFTPSGLGFQIGSSYFFRFEPRYQDTRYLLKLLLFSHTLERHPLTVTVPVGGTAHDVVVGRLSTTGAPAELEFEIDIAEQSGRETEVSFRIRDNDDGEWGIMAASVEAVPRTSLADDASDLGVDRLRFWPRGPISDPNIAKLLARQNELKAASRRVGMWHHAFGSQSDMRIAITSATFVDILEDAAPTLGRLLYSGETTRTLHWRVCAFCSDSTTAGEVSIASSGGSDTITIPAGMTSIDWAPYAWSSPGELTVDAEDPTTASGLRSGAWDGLTVQARRTAGSGTIYIVGVSVWEPSEGLLSVPLVSGARTFSADAAMADPRSGWAFEAADTDVSYRSVTQPRVFRDGAMLVEGYRKNLLGDSTDLTDAFYSVWQTPVRSAGGGAPNGGISYVYADDSAASTEDYRKTSITVSASTAYAVSCYVKKNSATAYPALRIIAGVGPEDWIYHIDATNGAMQKETGATDADYTFVCDAGDWWRVGFVFTTGAAETSVGWYFAPAKGSSLGTAAASAIGQVEAWGFQLEEGGFASSLIETTTAAVERGDDGFAFTPGSEITQGAWSITVCPSYSSSDAPSTARILYHGVDAYLAVVSGTLRLRANSTNYDISGLSFDAFEEATITVDFAAGSMTLSGWGGGSVAVGNDWSATGDFYIGSLDDGTESFFGTVSRPVAA